MQVDKTTQIIYLFFAYHSLATMNAIDRILEAKSIVLDKDNHQLTKEGVEILRRIKRAKK